MKLIAVYKAEPLGGQDVPSATLSITGKALRWSEKETLAERRRFFDGEAEKILDALSSLPGGTWDALLVAMLRRHQSVLLVPRRAWDTKRPRRTRG